MKLTIHTTDGGTLNIQDFKPDGLMDLIEVWRNGDDELLGFALNDGMAYIPKRAVTRIDTTD